MYNTRVKQVHYISRSLDDTKAVAQAVLDQPTVRVLALAGDLGSGKTAFTQCFAELLGVTDSVSSPTFTLVHHYKTNDNRTLVHSDFYRITKPEIPELGISDYFSDPHALTVVEWADRHPDFFPAHTLWLLFEITGEYRTITLRCNDETFWKQYQKRLTV